MYLQEFAITDNFLLCILLFSFPLKPWINSFLEQNRCNQIYWCLVQQRQDLYNDAGKVPYGTKKFLSFNVNFALCLHAAVRTPEQCK